MLIARFQSRAALIGLSLAIVLLGGGMARADQGSCGTQEKWCEHKVATFCADEACSNVRSEGECVSQDKSCEEFWCGNRQCESNWLISKNVCCVYFTSGHSPKYSCAMSELSCQGNTTQLTIRPPTLASSNGQQETN